MSPAIHELLVLLADWGFDPSPRSLTRCARATGIPVCRVRHALVVLAAGGFCVRDAKTRTWRLTFRGRTAVQAMRSVIDERYHGVPKMRLSEIDEMSDIWKDLLRIYQEWQLRSSRCSLGDMDA
ncbi:MAG: hypothetical protein N3A02_07560 [Rectinema sp.]|nr:hypothetical protein [Rectinema sp.]